MGRRRLAYTVRKFNDGFYVLLIIAAAGSLVTEIERRLRVSEQVIKFITVRTDEEDKRLAKVKAIRDTKVKRSAQPQAIPEAALPASMPPTLADAKAENLPQTVADGSLSEANLQPEAPGCHRSPCCRRSSRREPRPRPSRSRLAGFAFVVKHVILTLSLPKGRDPRKSLCCCRFCCPPGVDPPGNTHTP